MKSLSALGGATRESLIGFLGNVNFRSRISIYDARDSVPVRKRRTNLKKRRVSVEEGCQFRRQTVKTSFPGRYASNLSGQVERGDC